MQVCPAELSGIAWITTISSNLDRHKLHGIPKIEGFLRDLLHSAHGKNVYLTTRFYSEAETGYPCCKICAWSRLLERSVIIHMTVEGLMSGPLGPGYHHTPSQDDLVLKQDSAFQNGGSAHDYLDLWNSWLKESQSLPLRWIWAMKMWAPLLLHSIAFSASPLHVIKIITIEQPGWRIWLLKIQIVIWYHEARGDFCVLWGMTVLSNAELLFTDVKGRPLFAHSGPEC